MDGTALEVIKNDQIEIRIEDYFLSNGSGDDFGVTLGVLDISDTYTPMIELSSASYDQVLLAEQVRSVSTGLYADSVTGTIFNDYVRLGSGDDNAQTSLGKDIVFGEEGNDYIVAGLQTSTAENALLDEDFVVGGAGRDILLGGVGNDTLHAGEIDDHLLLATSESDNSGDWADGGSGMDTVYGSLASDFLEGGAFRHAGKQRRGQPESQGDGHRPRKLVRQPDLCAHSTKCKRRAGSGGQCPGANGEGRRSLYLDTAGNPVYRPGR
jgi:Ca2+-binding RTX toxin-like protein